MIGTSGPCYHDQDEISWEDIGIEPELTTVTKLPRRVFTFSETQIAEAVEANGVDHVFLNFANYCSEEEVEEIVGIIEEYADVSMLGYGPSISDVKTVKEW